MDEQDRTASTAIGKPLGLVGGLISLLALLAGCGRSLPQPTLVPTVPPPAAVQETPPQGTPPAEEPEVFDIGEPTGSPTPTPFPTPTLAPGETLPPTPPPWRQVTLAHTESFDFDQRRKGVITWGDLYFLAEAEDQRGPCFWSNNRGQGEGRDMGFWPASAMETLLLPTDGFSKGCLPVEVGHVYVYRPADGSAIIVFRVAALEDQTVTLEYILRQR